MKTNTVIDRLKQSSTVFPVGTRSWAGRALVGMLGCALVLAALPTTVEARGQASPNAPFVELGALDSQAGETKNNFVLRAAGSMAKYAEAYDREVCGMIMTNGSNNAWRVRMVSNQMHVGCALVRFNERGYVPSGETIHTHKGRALSRSAAARLVHTELDHGPGYVVAGGQVYHVQHELADVERVGKYDKKAPIEVLSLGGHDRRPIIGQTAQQTLLRQVQERRRVEPSSRVPAGRTR